MGLCLRNRWGEIGVSAAASGSPATTNSAPGNVRRRSHSRAAWAQVVGTVISAAAIVVASVVALRGQAAVKHSSAASGSPETANSALEDAHLHSQIRAAWAQVVGTVISATAVIVAIVVALQGQATVKHNSQTALQQSEDSQLSTAITALGSGNAAERMAGLALLGQNVSSRIALSSNTGEPAADVLGNYQTALRVLSSYLSSQGQAFLTAARAARTTAPFGRGFGIPSSPGIPIDISYAAGQVQLLLELHSKVMALGSGRPNIDLSHDELMGQSWKGINFSWLASAFLRGIDLRGANLKSSRWGKGSDLQYSYLQCANLQGANFRRADLSHADLRGANVQGADFRNTSLQGLRGAYVYGTAKWSRLPSGIRILPAGDWNASACLRERG
jgi:hypothetical protein